MNDANELAPPRWVRLCRSVFCLVLAAGLSWRGILYDDPTGHSTAIPFAMCQFAAVSLALLGVFILANADSEPGPA